MAFALAVTARPRGGPEGTAGAWSAERSSTVCGALAAAPSSGGRVVLVRGEAGIGKSLLVSRFLDDVADRARGYLGRCDDLRTPQPLAPIFPVSEHR